MRVLWLIALGACEARLGGNAIENTLPDAAGDGIIDAEADAKVPLGPWGAPMPVPITAVNDDDPSLTGDQLELYFNRADDIFVTRRAAITDPWGPLAIVPELSIADVTDTTPEITYDGLTMFLASNRPPVDGALDLHVATRASRADKFGTPTKLTELSGGNREAASASGDGLVIVFESNRNGSNDTFIAERPNKAVAFGTPVAVAAVNTGTTSDGNPMLSADGLELYLNSDRSGNNELYVATRASTADDFGAPVLIDELNDPAAQDQDPWISPDGRTLYFVSDRLGTTQLFISTR